MNESHVCPECGNGTPADAPDGLCPRCLLGAVLLESPADVTEGPGEAIEDRLTDFGFSPVDQATIAPAVPVELDQFKRAVLDLGLIPARDFERFVAGALGGVQGLARALVAAGKLTPYQAAALAQGKARWLLIGNYFILDKLGAGGMGVVFKARHRRLGRVVALKVLPPSLARDKNLFLRFRREVDVAARLSHPNIVSVLDADEDRGVQFMTMEYIEGNDLDRSVRDGGRLPMDQALDCAIQAARGLEAAHAKGIVHRDIKPANLMLDESGVVRVLDLGLARLVEATNPFGETAPGPLTQSGIYMGTVDFMAPEQGIDSRRVDHRADIYSLGCTLCYLLTGRAPFDGATVLARLMAHQERPPASLLESRPEVPRALDAIYQRMMAKNPADRPAAMTEVVTMLETCRSSSIEAAAVRSGLKTLARSVVWKRAVPTGPSPDSRFLTEAEPFVLSLGPDAQPEDRSCDDRAANRRATPVPPTVVRDSPPLPEPAAATRPHPAHKSRRYVFTLGALALLGVACVGTILISRLRPGTAPKRFVTSVSPGETAGERTGGVPSPQHAADKPTATFNVATIHAYHGLEWRAVAASHDGRHALVGGGTQHAELLNVDRGNIEFPAFGWHYSTVSDMAITPDGRRGLVATFSVAKENRSRHNLNEGGTLWFWDLKTHKALFPMQQPYRGHVTSVALSADGRLGLSSGQSGELTLWDMMTGQSLRRLGPQAGAVSPHAMAFYPDGRHAATAGRDKLVHVWDLDTGHEQATLTGHDGTITGLAISADGRRIVTGSDDASVILWDAGRGAILHRFDMPANDKGARVAFDSEGHIVAAGNGMSGTPPKPGNLIVWDASTYAVMRRDERPFARHLAVATLPRGRVLTADAYAIRIWTPRPLGTVASEPPTIAHRRKDPVNLLALVAREPQKSWGKWPTRDGALESPGTRYARLQIPYAAPSDYRIDMKVELVGKEPDQPLGLGLVVGGRHTEIVIDKLLAADGRQARSLVKNGRYSGVDDVDGVPVPFGLNAHHGQLLFPSRPVQLAVTVRPDSIRLTCDGTSVVDWNGDPKGLIPQEHWNWIDSNSLFLSSYGSIRIHEMTLTPLPAARP